MNNINKFLSIIFLLIVHFSYSQKGINTHNPSAMLDIVSITGNKALKISNTDSEIFTVLNNGNLGLNVISPLAKFHSTSTIKFTGLQIDNEKSKLSTTDISGNVTTRQVSTILPRVLAGTNGLDAIAVNQSISSINGIATYTNNLHVKNFTITETSLVNFSYQLSIDNILNSTNMPLTNGLSKQIGARLTWKSLPAGSLFSINGVVHTNALHFMNKSSSYVKGSYYCGGNSYIVLSPGNYSIELKGYVYAFDEINGISATFGSSNYDRLDIIAIPLK